MDKWTTRAIRYASNLLLSRESSPSVIPFAPQKTAFLIPDARTLRRSSPGKHGVDAARITALLSELEAEPRAEMHNLLILHRGEVIAECSRPGYSVSLPHLSHSMTKSLTAMLIGLLVTDGKLSVDDYVSDFFPEYKAQDARFDGMTVKHLLTMTSGLGFSEIGSVTEERWVEAIFSAPLKAAPGEVFSYNSMNSYLLSAIAAKQTGGNNTAFLKERLLSPLGITSYLFEKSPEGIEKGGFGAYLSTEAWAKLGLLLLQGGVWNGVRLLDEAFVREATTRQIATPPEKNSFDYGYQIWIARDGESFLFNGMFGQNVCAYPASGLVFAMQAGNDELFSDSPALTILRTALGDPGVFSGAKEDRRVHRALESAEEGFFRARTGALPLVKKRNLLTLLGLSHPKIPAEWDALVGEYDFAENRAGVLPLLVRTMQNNHTPGLLSLTVEKEREALLLTFAEGEERRKIRVGLFGYEESKLSFGDEEYLVRAVGGLEKSNTGAPVYKIELVFPELPDVTVLTLSRPEEDRLSLSMKETPDDAILSPFLDRFAGQNKILAFAIEKFDLAERARAAFAPALVAAKRSSPRKDEILDAGNEAFRADVAEGRKTAALIEKFIGGEDVGDEPKQGFLSSLISKFLFR